MSRHSAVPSSKAETLQLLPALVPSDGDGPVLAIFIGTADAVGGDALQLAAVLQLCSQWDYASSLGEDRDAFDCHRNLDVLPALSSIGFRTSCPFPKVTV